MRSFSNNRPRNTQNTQNFIFSVFRVFCGKLKPAETTPSGRSYLRLIKRLQKYGWQVVLLYLSLPDVEMSVARVKERVAHGGHDIPEADIRRRYLRSIRNLLGEYGKLCDITLCFDNSANPVLIYSKQGDTVSVETPMIYQQLLEQFDNETG